MKLVFATTGVREIDPIISEQIEVSTNGSLLTQTGVL